MDEHDYYGRYYFMGVTFDVEPGEQGIVASMPGVPKGYEIVLVPVGEDQYRMNSGPFVGGTITFLRDTLGAIQSIQAGEIELAKIAPERSDNLPQIERHLAPEMVRVPEKIKAFESLLQETRQKNDGSRIHYDLPYPKHEFVQYVTECEVVIFHGSNNEGIKTFKPVRKSFELRDASGRGNLQAVYGTHDGLWSMFFAVVDRERLKGSIRNGVMVFQNRAGQRLAMYNFSINEDQLTERPWCPGALYFLPRDTFVRLNLMEGVYANEWASERPVKPIAKMRIYPPDFPFLDQIGGHDDRELIRLQTISDAIQKAATAALHEGDRFSIELPPHERLVEDLAAYVEMQKIYIPAADFHVEKTRDALRLTISSPPPAVLQALLDRYRDLM